MDDQGHQPQETPGLRRRLGRGLNALLGGGRTDLDPEPAPAPQPAEASFDTPADAAGHPDVHHPSEIDVELIHRNPFQPRRDFDEETLSELAESIRQHGVLQPLLVRDMPADGDSAGEYQLIAGERRLLAAKQAGLSTVPCRLLDLPDRAVCEAAIEENLKRKDLGVLEKALAFQDYLERFGSTIEDLARQLSMNRSTVSNYLRLLELAGPVKDALNARHISGGHARALLPLEAAEQIALCTRITDEHLSVRKTELAVRELLQARSEQPPAETTPAEPAAEQPDTIPFEQAGRANPHVTSHVLSMQDSLREMLGLKVQIKLTDKDAGKIVIGFNSNDEFERLVGHLRRAA